MASALRVAFAGTPEFAAVALQALLDAGFEVPLVLSQPDRPAGRGMKLQASPVKQLAVARHRRGPAAQPAARRQVPRRGRGGPAGAGRRAPGRAHRRRLRPDPADVGAGTAATGLPEHPRLDPAALARRRADPPRHRGRRRRDRHHHHADGRGPGHRRHAAARAAADRRGGHRPRRCTTSWRRSAAG